MPRPPKKVGTRGFGQDAASIQRISRRVSETEDRPAAWRGKVCKALNDAVSLLNEDVERQLQTKPRP
jgi:hypothetical protein